MKKNALIIFMGLFAVFCLTLCISAADHAYVGPEKCKMCHKIEYTSWSASKHAKSWDSLTLAQQKDVKCNGCHSTKLPEITGVSCEVCHGPGADYMKMSVMKDKKMAIQNGLIMPTAEVCIRCHNKKSPNFKGFSWETAKIKVHEFKNNPFKN